MKTNTNITYKEFKETDIFKSANIVEFINAKGGSSFDDISDKALESMIVKDYNYESGYLEIVLREEEDNMFISEVAYELYKQNWIDTHTTPELRLQVINDYYNYIQEAMEDEDCEDFQDYNSLEEYIYDNGYPNGEMYVCFDEFLDNEFQDKKYMKKLFHNVVLYADYLLALDHMNK